MKLRGVREYQSGWVQTATAIVALVFSILTGLGIITPEQSTAAGPEVGTLLGSISAGIVAVIGLIGIFFKPSA